MTVPQPGGPASFFGRRFFLTERLGSGARGEVFLAEQESPGGFRRRVALKVLRTNLPPAQASEAAQRIREEAKLLGRLSHRSIVAVMDLVLLGGNWAVVMEPVAGPDLERVVGALALDQRRLPMRAAFEVVASVADALDAAWNADDGQGGTLRLIHRDLKPSNVLLTRDGDVKVLDFGGPRMNLDSEKTAPKRYLAPERVLLGSDTPSGDVYALAVVLAELLIGTSMPASPLDPNRHAELVERTVHGVSTRLRGDPPTISDAENLLRAALDADPSRRPSARMMGDICASIAPRLVSEALRPFARVFVPRVDALLGRTAMLTSRTLTETTLTIDPSPLPAPRRGRRRSPWRLGIFALLLAGTSVAVMFVLGVAFVWVHWMLLGSAELQAQERAAESSEQSASPPPVVEGAVPPLAAPLADSVAPIPGEASPTPDLPAASVASPGGEGRDRTGAAARPPDAVDAPIRPQKVSSPNLSNEEEQRVLVISEPSGTPDEVVGLPSAPVAGTPSASVSIDPAVGRALPARYAVPDAKGLRLALRAIEVHLVMAGAAEAQVSDVTRAFEQEVLRTAIPSVPLDIYPRPMFDLIIAEVARGASSAELSERLLEAHRRGALRKDARGAR